MPKDHKDKKEVAVRKPVSSNLLKVYYINKYNGDYARWHSTNENSKKVYRNELKKIVARFVKEFESKKIKK